MKRKHILFIIINLGLSGAVKALVNLINHLGTEKYAISIMTHEQESAYCREINRPVNYLSVARPKDMFFGKKSQYGQSQFMTCFDSGFVKAAYALSHYDVLFLFRDSAYIKLLPDAKGNNVSVLRLSTDYLNNPVAWTFIDSNVYVGMHKHCYKKICNIISGSSQASSSFSAVTGIYDNVSVVNNIFDKQRIIELSNVHINISKSHFVIGSVGRLAPLKGHSRLIDVCYKLKSEGFSFELWLIGTGSEEGILVSKAKEYNLDNVKFLGLQENPYKFMSHFDLYVNPAFIEGSPNAPCEAVILGIPCVVTDHCGARDIFGDSKYGMVVANTEDGLYNGVKQMLSNKELYWHYKVMTKKKQTFFDSARSIEQYEALFIVK